MKTCKRVHYSGHVQGVGFRYSTASFARQYEVTGYVKNLPDGRVELVVEGAAAEVERFLQGVSRQLAEHIEAQHVDDMPEQGFDSFGIRM